MKVATVQRERDDESSVAGRVREGATGWIGRFRSFLSGVRNEMTRVTWPSRREVWATTIVVIITSFIFGAYLWGVDLLLSAALGALFRYFGVA
jgi:preprotein translocase subunit SecE